MQISINQLLIVRQRDFNVLNRAFAVALGNNYTNQEYTLTREDALKAAAEIEAIAAEAEEDNPMFPLSAEQKLGCIREANTAAESFRDLICNVFKLS